jgi:hypothetical protein
MITKVQPIERDEWQRLAPTFMDYNYCQFWDYGAACAGRVGAHNEHVAIYEGDDLIGLTDVRIKEVPIFRKGIAYINNGPLVRRNDPFDAERLKGVLSALVNQYVVGKKLILRVQPSPSSNILLDRQEQIYLDIGFTAPNRLRYDRTIILDISQPLEMIRKQFDQKWRNQLNNVEKRNLVIKMGTDDSLFSVFCQLHEELINRKMFDVQLDANFYSKVQRFLSGDERFIVTVVYKDELPISGNMSSIIGNTCMYVLGASNDVGLKNKASYLVQWSVIQKAKEKHCRFYDLCGIDPEKNPGVYHFKKGMGGVDVTIPTFEAYPNLWSRNIVHFGEQAYRLYRKVRKP